ncbi:hypothetical protein GQ44DRAFT_405207 [Phaeosphaeriaceae sp. PMI808]|nr:hypothetical protein GQ44DRAFT_405207 [Phaeosphaeriaceae sp. PMI808]
MYEACVLWEESLEFNPQVLCWITKYDFEGGKPIQVGIEKWSSNKQQLKNTVRTSAKTGTHQENLKVSYIVYKAAEWNKKSNTIFTARSQAFKGAGPRKLSAPYPSLYFEFPKGMFSEPPAIMLGFYCLSFAAGADPQVEVRADALSKDGVWVSAGPWKDAGMGVSLIAIA